METGSLFNETGLAPLGGAVRTDAVGITCRAAVDAIAAVFALVAMAPKARERAAKSADPDYVALARLVINAGVPIGM